MFEFTNTLLKNTHQESSQIDVQAVEQICGKYIQSKTIKTKYGIRRLSFQ